MYLGLIQPLLRQLGPPTRWQALDTATDVYPVGICVFLPSLTTPATYQLVSGTDAENIPFIVHPIDFNASTNAKVWKQRM
jgi:hypothetical protein